MGRVPGAIEGVEATLREEVNDKLKGCAALILREVSAASKSDVADRHLETIFLAIDDAMRVVTNRVTAMEAKVPSLRARRTISHWSWAASRRRRRSSTSSRAFAGRRGVLLARGARDSPRRRVFRWTRPLIRWSQCGKFLGVSGQDGVLSHAAP